MSDTGGSAFPVQMQKNLNDDIILWPDAGMTLRDYFAAQALAALVRVHTDSPEEHLAEWAYRQADAMLKSRATL